MPSDFVNEVIYSTDKNSILEMFRDLGSSLVGLLKIAAGDLDRLSELVKDFTTILPVKQFKISGKDAVTVEVDIVGAGRMVESTECTFEFFKSILNGYGYSATRQEIGVGTLRIWAAKRGYS